MIKDYYITYFKEKHHSQQNLTEFSNLSGMISARKSLKIRSLTAFQN